MACPTGCGFKLTKQGAEAKLYIGDYLGKPTIIKERFLKTYRHPDLDPKLTKDRMKAEARSIVRCKQSGIKTPALYLVDFDRRRIYMEYIENSITVKDFIISLTEDADLISNGDESFSDSLYKLTDKIGEVLACMHKNNIIHGDLTTSNMLLTPIPKDLRNIKDLESSEIVLIDFGLSFVASSAEDKGVDLYVLERALTSTHSIVPDLFVRVLEMYKKVSKKDSKEVLEKYEEISARGRKRTMVG